MKHVHVARVVHRVAKDHGVHVNDDKGDRVPMLVPKAKDNKGTKSYDELCDVLRSGFPGVV